MKSTQGTSSFRYTGMLTYLLPLVILVALAARNNDYPLYTALAAMMAATLQLFGFFFSPAPHGLWQQSRWLMASKTAFIAVIIIIGIQLLPGLGSPISRQLYGLAAQTTGITATSHISLNVYATLLSALQIIASAAMFMMGFQVAANRKEVVRLVTLLVIMIGGYCLIGLIMYSYAAEEASQKGMSYLPRLTTMLGNNQESLLIGVGLLLSLTLLCDRFERVRQNYRNASKSVRINIFLRKTWLYLLLSGLFVTALVLSGSRAGIVCAFVGVPLFFLLNLVSRKRKRYLPLLIGIGGSFALLLLALMTAGSEVMSRYANIQHDIPKRLQIMSDTWEATRHFFWFGSGLGGFGDVFKMFRSEAMFAIYENSLVVHSFNIYLEGLLTFGAIGMLAITITFLSLMALCLQGVFRRNRQKAYPAAAFAISCMLAIHGLVDYSLLVPAISMLAALVLGIGCAQSFPEEQRL